MPVGFDSEFSWTDAAPAAIDASLKLRWSVSFCLGSFSHTAGIQIDMASTVTMPNACMRTSRGSSSWASEGPGFMAGGMSGVPGRRGRRSKRYALPPRKMQSTTITIAIVRPRPPDRASTVMTASPAPRSSARRPAHAERALRGLVDGVGAAGRAVDELRGVHSDVRPFDLQRESSEARRGRSQLVFTGAVVLRAVARALEPLAGLAERNSAAQVHALLVERHQ